MGEKLKLSRRNEDDINALIPLAARWTDRKLNVNIMRFSPGRQTWEWAREFIDRMNEITIAAGLRVGYKELMRARDELWV